MSDDVRSLPILTREMVLDRAALAQRAEGDERIPMSLSSEYAVERGGFWSEPFMEVLDHSTDAVDLGRVEGGLPLLVDHDPTRQVGVVEDVHIGADKVLRGMARFSRNPFAQEVKRDVEDGIKTRTSIGYRVREMVQEKKADDEGIARMRATRWQLFENSIVSIPADPTVGVGRNADEAAYPVVIRTLTPLPTPPAPQARSHTVSDQNTAPAGAAPEIRVVSDAASDARAREISALAAQHAMTDKLPEWIGNGRSVEDVRGEIISELKARLARGPVVAPRVELTEKEQKEYSFARAILQQDEGTKGFEREVSEEIARKLPAGYKPQGGFFIPTTIRAGLDSGTSTKGAEIKFTSPGSFIDMLRNRARVLQAGATLLPGLDGPVSFPKQNGAGTASWVAENPGTDVAESNLLLTTVSLAAKTLQSTTSFSRQLLRQAVVDVENLVRADIAAIHALAIDAGALYGTGASNQPTGVYVASGTTVVALGTNGAAPTYVNMVNLSVAVEQANADDLGGLAVITTPGIKGTLKTTQRFSGTDGAAVWGDDDMVAGMRGYSTNQVQSNLTKGTGTNLHAIYAGAWSQLLIAEFGAMEVITDPYRLKKQGMIEVTSFQMVDVAVRHAGAFAIIKDAISAF